MREKQSVVEEHRTTSALRHRQADAIASDLLHALRLECGAIEPISFSFEIPFGCPAADVIHTTWHRVDVQLLVPDLQFGGSFFKTIRNGHALASCRFSRPPCLLHRPNRHELP